MEAQAKSGPIQATNKLPTIEKQYKESWLYAFFRGIKLEFVAKLLQLKRVEVMIVPIFNRAVESKEPVPRFYVNDRHLTKGALVGVNGQYCVEAGDEGAESIQRCIDQNNRLPNETRSWAQLIKSSPTNQFSEEQLEATCTALESTVKEKNLQLEKWHSNELETLQKLHTQRTSEDTGAKYLPSLVKADGKEFKAYSGLPAVLTCPKAGESLKPFADRLKPVMECMVYTHSKGYSHGCVSKECVVEHEGQVKLDGFGMAKQQQASAEPHDEAMMNRVKYFSDTIFNVPHPELLPPEAFTHAKGYETAGDMWALGISLAHWIAPEACQKITDEFKGETLQNTGKLEKSKNALIEYSNKLREACSKTLTRNTRSGHRFMISELLPKLLEANPEQRITAEKALSHRCFQEKWDNPNPPRN
ncbi:MAG: protein kinase domain-containing protein [Endozoicomonas sp.]|uniref:protein kinase domain-containing protein n=1 Tax=Endozoicomonas sp. TaxID=1892382 RepID=UPI003D9B9D5B